MRAAMPVLLATAACSDATAPLDIRPPDQLNILRLLPTAPPLLADSTTFTACKGQGAEGRLVFNDGSGGEGEEFARLTLDGGSLLAKPDGTLFTQGECIQITMAVDDPTHVLVRLEPSGLRFDPSHPAQLKLEYGEAEGVDSTVEAKIAIWRQESAGAPFVQMGSAVVKDLQEVEAALLGFSRYALAY
ncbi:MAG TPA: hypothetical protein VI297_05870 [Gemmatimonadales bacterium]